jgi:CelD/BcsL family acetyltransferase involved in cellulose biosynthesis
MTTAIATTDSTATVDTTPSVALTFRPESARTEVLALWRELEHRLSPCPLACSADWADVWLAHFGGTVPHRFAVFQVDDTPVAVGLLTRGVAQRDGLVPVQSWHVGTAGEPDAHSVCIEYNALLCQPSARTAVWQTLFAALELEPDWDELRLDGFVAADVAEILGPDDRWQVVRKPARFVDLEAVRQSGQELITFFGDSTRKGIRQNLRDYVGLTVEWAKTVDHAADIFSDLICLHQLRWQADGQPGCYSSELFTAFHHALLERLVPQGRMALCRVRCGDQTLGCSQLLVDRNRVLVYQGGRAAGDKKHSPGLVTDYLAMQEAFRRGYAAFDFLAGDSTHKRRLTTQTTELAWAVRRRPRLKFTVMDQLRQIKRWLQSLQNLDGPQPPSGDTHRADHA